MKSLMYELLGFYLYSNNLVFKKYIFKQSLMWRLSWHFDSVLQENFTALWFQNVIWEFKQFWADFYSRKDIMHH